MDRGDVATLYRRHVTMVSGRAKRLLGNSAAAEDAAQEAFIRFIEHQRRGGKVDDVPAFLYRTVSNLALNSLRNDRRRCEILAAEGPPRTGAAEPLDER